MKEAYALNCAGETDSNGQYLYGTGHVVRAGEIWDIDFRAWCK